MPEVDRCRGRLAQFCVGNGIDVGHGGVMPIIPTAIALDRAEDNPDRAHFQNAASWPTQLVGDATSLYWFADGVLDYVFSSHVLEDFIDTEIVLQEWLRVIRPGGHLVLFCPDQAVYEAYCKERGELPNMAHKHPRFSLQFVKDILFRMGINPAQIVHEIPLIDAYSWDLVVRK